MNFAYSSDLSKDVHKAFTARPQTHYKNTAFKKYGARSCNQNFQYTNKIYEKQDHWCETCDKGFYTVQQLHVHKQEHQKCNIDGCQFVAHPKVITKHIQMQHSTGLYSKISRLNDPEEVKKWKEERKMKYPTKANIAKKAAEMSEKLQRGERMGLHKDNMQKGHKRKSTLKNNYRSRKQKKVMENETDIEHRKGILQKNKKRVFLKTTTISENQCTSHYGLKPFTGIQDLVLQDEDPNTEVHSGVVLDIDDNEWTENLLNTSYKTLKEDIQCNALSNLICNYGSDSELEKVPDYKNDIKENSKLYPMIIEETAMNLNTNEKPIILSDDSGPEEIKIDKKQPGFVDYSSEKERVIPKKAFRRNIKPSAQKYTKSKLPSTLLQKLLYKEMKYERNVTLQCIRHIINNNYFCNHDIK